MRRAALALACLTLAAPLAAAEVVVEDVEGNPGYYTSKFYLRPHYQLEGMDIGMSLVSKLPAGK